jgi:carboxylesterase
MKYALVIGVAIAALVIRAVLLSRFVNRLAARRTLGPDGVVIGGGPIAIAGPPGAPRLLLLHGAGDTPQTLEFLARTLAGHGYEVRVPLLPGHGRSLTDFARVTADALYAAVAREYGELAASGEAAVGVVGLSMGGALAVQLAAARPNLEALCLLAPYLAMPAGIQWAARLSHVWGPVAPFVSAAGGQSILDPDEAAKNRAYGAFTPEALRALRDVVRRAQAALPRVQAPTLMIQSRTDNRIAAPAAEVAFARLGAHEKRLQWVTGAAHVISVDYGREQVAAAVAEWMDRRLRPAGAP